MKKTLVAFGLAALPLVAACGSNVETNAGGGGQGTNTAGGGQGTTTTSTDPASCSGGTSLDISWDGQTSGPSYHCWEDIDDGAFELDASVVSVDKGAITLDTCSPLADCAGSLQTLHVDAEGLGFAIPAGTFVHVKFFLHANIACFAGARVTNLPSWDGVSNPTTTAPLIWVDAVIGNQGTTQMEGPEYGLDPVAQTCSKAQPGDAVYDYRFYDPQDPSNAVTVPVGQVGTLHVQRSGQPQVWTFGNARAGCLSGPNGNCPGEGYPFDFWATQAPGE